MSAYDLWFFENACDKIFVWTTLTTTEIVPFRFDLLGRLSLDDWVFSTKTWWHQCLEHKAKAEPHKISSFFCGPGIGWILEQWKEGPLAFLRYIRDYTTQMFWDYMPSQGSLLTNQWNGLLQGFWALLVISGDIYVSLRLKISLKKKTMGWVSAPYWSINVNKHRPYRHTVHIRNYICIYIYTYS